MLNKPFFQGIQFFFQGFRLILEPGLKRYIVIPIIFNALLLIIIFAGLYFFLFHNLAHFLANYPKWVMALFGWLFWLFYSFITLMVSTLVFTLLTNIIASPFYGLLAEAAAKILSADKTGDNASVNENEGNDPGNNNSNVNNSWLKTALVIAPRTLAREGRKLLYFLPWLFICLLLLFFPFAWPIFPFVWWAVLTWVLAIQYIDYQPDNQQIPFKNVLALLQQNMLIIFGFGTMVSLAMMIPLANLFVPPAAVAGGTALWLFLQRGQILNIK